MKTLRTFQVLNKCQQISTNMLPLLSSDFCVTPHTNLHKNKRNNLYTSYCVVVLAHNKD